MLKIAIRKSEKNALLCKTEKARYIYTLSQWSPVMAKRWKLCASDCMLFHRLQLDSFHFLAGQRKWNGRARIPINQSLVTSKFSKLRERLLHPIVHRDLRRLIYIRGDSWLLRYKNRQYPIHDWCANRYYSHILRCAFKVRSAWVR